MLKLFLSKLWVYVRGLFAETKDGEWALSKGAVAFWVVFTHAMYVWNKFDASGAKLDISQGELYILFALLGYSGLKVGADAVKAMKQPSILDTQAIAKALAAGEPKDSKQEVG